jgi:hypothetical protein
MKQSVIWERHTDFISNRQEILLWEFSISELQRHYDVQIYSLPIEIELFRAIKAMAASGNKQLRERSFTIFMGDCGPGFELFAVGVPAKTSSRVTDLITGCFENIRGYETMEYGQIPFVPLIPCYRYDHGAMFEYTKDYFMAGKRRADDAVISGMGVFYRMYESAEGIGVRERYCEAPAPAMRKSSEENICLR